MQRQWPDRHYKYFRASVLARGRRDNRKLLIWMWLIIYSWEGSDFVAFWHAPLHVQIVGIQRGNIWMSVCVQHVSVSVRVSAYVWPCVSVCSSASFQHMYVTSDTLAVYQYLINSHSWAPPGLVIDFSFSRPWLHLASHADGMQCFQEHFLPKQKCGK